MEYENDERGYGGGEDPFHVLRSPTNISDISYTNSSLASDSAPRRRQTALPSRAATVTDLRRADDRAYDRDDDVRDLRNDRRGDEDARARSASPDGRERMDTR